MTAEIYQAVTDRVIELLDQGVAPWRNPIRSRGGEGGLPANVHSGRAYRGVNIFLLAVTSWLEGYASSGWLTYRQARERGGHVRRGEKGTLVVFWKRHATTDRESGEPITVPVLRRYTVFNTEQCRGLEPGLDQTPRELARPFQPLAKAELIVKRYDDPPEIAHHGSRAFYRPADDQVRIPEPGRFTDGASYYATLFHELSHSTGHAKRLDRGLDRTLTPFGSPDYSKEELVAEMGAAFLAAAAGIGPETIEQSAAYIDGWRRRISAEPKLVTHAAGAGQRAADWILDDRSNPDPSPQR